MADTRETANRLIDISPLIDAKIAVWPGDTAFERKVNLDMAAGANYTLSEIRTTLHVGAHSDAPLHYAAGGDDIASRSLDHYLGPCEVIAVDVARGERILPRHIASGRVAAARVLFRTGTFAGHHEWNDDFASLSPELVDWLHDRSVILVGIDTPSVDPFDSKALEAHNALARHDMTNLEGLVLGHVEPGVYELIALPLKIAGADASPVRAVLRVIG